MTSRLTRSNNSDRVPANADRRTDKQEAQPRSSAVFVNCSESSSIRCKSSLEAAATDSHEDRPLSVSSTLAALMTSWQWLPSEQRRARSGHVISRSTGDQSVDQSADRGGNQIYGPKYCQQVLSLSLKRVDRLQGSMGGTCKETDILSRPVMIQRSCSVQTIQTRSMLSSDK